MAVLPTAFCKVKKARQRPSSPAPEPTLLRLSPALRKNDLLVDGIKEAGTICPLFTDEIAAIVQHRLLGVGAADRDEELAPRMNGDRLRLGCAVIALHVGAIACIEQDDRNLGEIELTGIVQARHVPVV